MTRETWAQWREWHREREWRARVLFAPGSRGEALKRRKHAMMRRFRPPAAPQDVFAKDAEGRLVRCTMTLEPVRGTGWLAIWLAMPEHELAGGFRGWQIGVQPDRCMIRLHPDA